MKNERSSTYDASLLHTYFGGHGPLPLSILFLLLLSRVRFLCLCHPCSILFYRQSDLPMLFFASTHSMM